MDLTKAARVVGEERWKPVLMAALTMRSFRHVRRASSAFGCPLAGLMIVEVEEVVCPEDWE